VGRRHTTTISGHALPWNCATRRRYGRQPPLRRDSTDCQLPSWRDTGFPNNTAVGWVGPAPQDAWEMPGEASISPAAGGVGPTHPIQGPHHLDWWEHGGHTNKDKGVHACAFHHWLIHHTTWKIWRNPNGHIQVSRT
jgi:hypothetical protein